MPLPQITVRRGNCRLLMPILWIVLATGPSNVWPTASGQDPLTVQPNAPRTPSPDTAKSGTPGKVVPQKAVSQAASSGKAPRTDPQQKPDTSPPPQVQEFEIDKRSNLRFCRHDSPARESAGLCDVYLPVINSESQTGGEQNEGFPVVLLVHGGGWATGNKWTMDRHARQLTRRGYACVSMNYRLAPAAKFPSQVDDVRSALVWIGENATEYGFDLQRIGLYGYSAGGHLVSLVATLADEPWSKVRQTTAWPESDPRWKQLPRIDAVCAGGPPTDFRSLPPDNTTLAYFLGGSRRQCPDNYLAASPICFASSGDPAITIVHGEADGLVPVDGSRSFYKSLIDCNVDATIETLPRQGHLMAFISPALTEWMLTFFDNHLTKSRDEDQ